jgi:dipeptidyl aminopeptidase/acylaminoacyl peptidase
LKKLLILLVVLFLIVNGIAFMHAYRFTHFVENDRAFVKPDSLDWTQKANIILAGVYNPRPTLNSAPSRPYKVLQIASEGYLEAWEIKVPNSKGTVLMFHGYRSEKSSLLSRAEVFLNNGFNTILIDFHGSGGSEGNSTSIGYHEAKQVRDAFHAIHHSRPGKIHLFGISMGSVAILKAIDSYNITPDGIIIECPFGNLLQTVNARFDIMGVPKFPLSNLLTFWGGVQHGYWAFSHNPIDYAQSVKCPTLLLFGELDNRVSLEETNAIFQNLKGDKKLITYPNEGHELFTETNRKQWQKDVKQFLNTH